MMTVGNLGWRGDGSINSIILTHSWSDKFSSVHQFDVLGTNNSAAKLPDHRDLRTTQPA